MSIPDVIYITNYQTTLIKVLISATSKVGNLLYPLRQHRPRNLQITLLRRLKIAVASRFAGGEVAAPALDGEGDVGVAQIVELGFDLQLLGGAAEELADAVAVGDLEEDESRPGAFEVGGNVCDGKIRLQVAAVFLVSLGADPGADLLPAVLLVALQETGKGQLLAHLLRKDILEAQQAQGDVRAQLGDNPLGILDAAVEPLLLLPAVGEAEDDDRLAAPAGEPDFGDFGVVHIIPIEAICIV